MKRVIDYILSMHSAIILMLIFAFSIGAATFIENDYGTETAKALVYNAKWFEFLLFLLAVNLIFNIIRYRMWHPGKRLVFLFHASFIVILIGAAVTRYIGYEGMMHIREGSSSNEIISDRTFIQLEAAKNGKHLVYAKPVIFSRIGSNHIKQDIVVNNEELTLEVLRYIPNAVEKIVEDNTGKAIISLMIAYGETPMQITLKAGESYETPAFVIAFEKSMQSSKPVIEIDMKDGKLFAKLPFALQYLKMSDRSSGMLKEGNQELQTRHLYSGSGVNFVIKQAYEHAKVVISSADTKSAGPMMRNALDAVEMKLTMGQTSKIVTVYGTKGQPGEKVHTTLNGWNIAVSYGSRIIKLPFEIKLVDFQLERYPGSMSPSSYASEVIVIDPKNGVKMPFRIYMNHVLDYQGYRFFQSSYDMDEKGTILSVNHDPGTLPTYIGYIMLTIGIFGSMLTYSSRFQILMRRARDLQKLAKKHLPMVALLLFTSLISTPIYASDDAKKYNLPVIQKEHAKKFGELLVQDNGGRIEPIDTLAREVLRKITRKESHFGLNADQIFLSMIVRPENWQEVPLIKISLPGVNEILGINPKTKYAKFNDFFDFSKEENYKLGKLVEDITRKRPAERTKLDKEILRVDERVNVMYMTFTGSLLRIFPNPKDKTGRWYAPLDAINHFDEKNGKFVQAILASYFSNIDSSLKNKDWSKADKALEVIKEYQEFYGAAIIPSKGRIEAELFMNEFKPFQRLIPIYLGLGFILLLLSIYHVIKPKFNLQLPVKVAMGLLIFGFFVQTTGLGLRWYISGHAPWSNGYESMLYISWATLLAGFIFSKKSPITLAATGILSGLILFVAHLNWLDPEITNLVPVLKSYWLMIHVAVITASYGFLGLGALLAFITLWLYIIKEKKNRVNIEYSIRELTHINEMSLIFGLALLTVGNFLGGVWANESWGRYWGWDPKETWALVTILVYAAVVHLRFVKSMRGIFAFNVASLLAFSSVVMTYFGVNYYLSGMHSYAKGDPVPIPTFVYYVVVIVVITIILAYRKRELLPIKQKK
ncbi:cytochrome c biogenesis protein CcsA [Hydrogenimonas thermophila]|uniref:Cytochrome c-type biogenesis protein CcsB n=1 Tax=Hydrogenimonas thermophila TaxID=223786 RepID=A0A1I5MJD0_9BACT|nr:cytochrome c biogenesis protein CcsA [Hydrogenimonas thermophila]SFP09407.1 cytochrome c-type biogenesis protein CcsB [Hydrogenimonas thermophila]